jgi:ligand-binding sensor domain-containing protein/signal transduction histidine kinase/CheY-like chemotaxis protein
MIRFTAILLLNGLFGTFAGLAQSTRPGFKHISKDQGLTANKILCIKQDKTGFMWFGTEDGLTRFDGTNYIAFRHDASDKYSLINNVVNCIYEDPVNGNLWIGTAAGLCWLNIKDYKIYSDVNLNESLGNVNIFSIYFDNAGNKWLGTLNGLYYYGRNAKRPIQWLKNPSTKTKSTVNCFFEDSNKKLWIGTNFGLYSLSPRLRKLTYYKLPNREVKVVSISEDSRKNLWVSTASSGVFEIRGNYTVKQYCTENGYLKKSNKVQGVVEDDLGNLYMAVRDGAGLHYLDYKKKTIKIYSPDFFDPNGITSAALTSIFKDRFKNIWIGTWATGLNLIDYNKKPFAHYTVSYKPNGMMNGYTRAVFQDSDGDIWIGTREQGCLIKFDPDKGTFTNHKEWLFNPRQGDYSLVLSIAEAKPGYLLVGTLNNGLNLYNKKTQQFTRYLHKPSDNTSLADNKVTALIKDRFNTIWVGTSNALQTLDLNTGKFSFLRDSCHVKCFLDYSDDELYFAGSVGLFSYSRSRKTITRYHKRSKINGGEVPDITGIRKDSQGNLWLSTIGKGVMHFDKKNRRFTSYSLKDGLPSTIACALEIDKKGDLWISTTNGLSRFNPNTKKFRNYYVGEGLQSNEFEKFVGLKTTDGHLLFGGSNGFNYFYPDSIKDNLVIPRVVLTDFKIFNKPVKIGDDDSPLTQTITSTDQITLNHKQSVFTFGFNALNFSSPMYNQYAYKLEPLEKDWNYSGMRNVASYSSLPAGNYTFMVKASNNDGIWNESPTTLHIKVLPAPWKTWWAYLFYISVISGLIYLWLNYKNQLHIAKAEQEKLKELNSIKSQFFTNISHEFKTPLTMILSPVGKLMKIASTDQEKKHLQYINRNALRLQNLINQLMELRCIENNSLTPQYSKGDLVAYLRELVKVFEPLADEHAIKLLFESEQDIETYFDPDKIEKIFYNILSNAVKFTPNQGLVIVSISLINNQSKKSRFDGSYIEVSITNTGSKIDSEHIPHIFKNYYHIDRQNTLPQPGTGIGLAFAKELVDLLGGTIDVESTNECTQFTVRLPDIKLSKHDVDLQVKLKDKDFAYSKHLMEVIEFEKKLSQETKGSNAKGPSILLIEDNKELRELLFNTLSRSYKITMAKDGLEGLELAHRIHPELVVSDIIMPKLSGIELCREMKTNIELNHIPIVLLTASTTDAQKLASMENGADVYLEKPFDPDFLKLQIKNILRTRKAQREAFAKKLSAEPEKAADNTADEKWLVKAISIVEKNLDHFDFDVDAFAKEMNMSRTGLYQKLKSLTNFSTNEFIINIRLKKAVELLKHSDLSFSEIAYKVGFNSPNYFGICFKKNYQITPSKFVEMHRRDLK